MIESSEAFRRANMAETADTRYTLFRAVIDVEDPDIIYGRLASSGAAAWSKPEQVHDKVMDTDGKYATLERNRWLLDGSFRLIPDEPQQLTGQIGYVGNTLSGSDGSFPSGTYAEQQIQNVSILQACSIYFPQEDVDGVPVDFTVEVFQGNTAYFTKTFTGNTARSVSMDGFTVYDPDRIRVTVTKWSLPGRYLRIAEIIAGVYEEWDLRMVADLGVTHQSDVSCLSLPYGTCTLTVDNTDRRFEPRKKQSLFQSIEERQGIRMDIGLRLPDGSAEWKPAGVFYQKGDGWKTSTNEPTIRWDLVDIIGLVCERTFLPPDTLPTTLDGWIAAIVGQLGENFSGRYHVDPDYASLAVTANSVEDVTGKKCGDMLRWACQATGTWPRADQETGYLTAEPLWNEGGKITLMNILHYPTMKANEDLAALIFKLHDESDTQVVISGNSASASKTVTIDNPFIHTNAQALAAARLILSCYGGNQLETTGRGDPSSEIGDVDTVWLDESNATTGRRVYQTFNIKKGVLQNCDSRLLQADGSYLYTEFAVITQSGTWKAPAGVTQLRVVIGAGGQGGGKGWDGYISLSGNLGNQMAAGEGDPGVDGIGGKVWYGVININPEQEFTVHLGAGGAPGTTPGQAGAMGEDTTFGVYSSANGKIYENGYTDIANGQSFSRTGVAVPLPGTGDGGKGGEGGEAGIGYIKWVERKYGGSEKAELVVIQEGGPGQPGKPGATGFVMVTWDKV